MFFVVCINLITSRLAKYFYLIICYYYRKILEEILRVEYVDTDSTPNSLSFLTE